VNGDGTGDIGGRVSAVISERARLAVAAVDTATTAPPKLTPALFAERTRPAQPVTLRGPSTNS